MDEVLTYQEIHDMLYCNEMEINEVVLEENELASVQFISGQSQKVKNELEIGEIVTDTESAIDPEVSELDFLSAAEALQKQSQEEELDMRPYLFDGNSKSYILLDSGSQVCAWPPDPGDQIDPTTKLKAVNGSGLKCYGFKEVDIKINRKTYPIRVIKTDVAKPILGWNFTRKFRLSTGWTEWGDVVLSDPKAKVSQILKYKSITNQTHKVSVVEREDSVHKSAAQLAFEVAAMKSLDKAEHTVLVNDINKMPESDYKELVKKFPQLKGPQG